jgi:PAS domain S-box-containing protein
VAEPSDEPGRAAVATPYPRGGRWRALLVVLVVLGLTAAATVAVARTERDNERGRRERLVDRVVGILDQTRNEALASGVAASSLVGPDGAFNPWAFGEVGSSVLASTSASIVAYVEVVEAGERQAWEQLWGREITDGDARTGTSGPAVERDRYLVVTAVLPDEPWYTALRGWDMAGDSTFGPPASAVLNGSEAQASSLFDFPGGNRGFAIVVPVTDPSGDVAGFVAPFYAADAFLPALAGALPEDGGVRVTDSDETVLEAGQLVGPSTGRTIDVFGQDWDVTVAVPAGPADWPVVLLGGFALALLAGLVLWRAQRTARTRDELYDAERAARARADEVQAALAVSEQRFRALLMAITKIVFTADRYGGMERSESWERFTGQRPEDYTGPAMGGFLAVHPDDRARLKAQWDECLATGERLETTYRLRRADGEHRRVRVASVPMRDDDGVVREWVGSIADVEDQLRADEALARQSQLTETITENASSALFLMDAHGHPTYMNTSAEEMFGYRLEEIAHAPLHDAIHHTRPDGTPYAMEDCPIDRALPERRWIEPYDDLFVRKDGSFVRVRAAASPIMRGDEPVGTVVEVQDVSKEYQLLHNEREARQRAQLLERNATRLAGAATVEEVAASTLADLGAVGVGMAAIRVVRDGLVDVVATHGVDPEAMAAHSGLPVGADPTPSAEAIRINDVVELHSAEELDERFPGSVVLRDQVGAQAVIAFPLRATNGAVLGSFTVASASVDWLDDDLRLLFVGLAEQCGLAIERALLQTQVSLASKRSSFLALLSDTLERRVTVRERAECAVELIAEQWDVVAAVFLHDADERLGLVASSSLWSDLDPDQLTSGAGSAVELPTPIPGTVIVIDDRIRLVLPLVARGRELGLLVVDVAAAPGSRAGMDAALATDAGARLAVALDNARMYEHERDVSHALQVGLLSGSLQQVDGVLLSSSYRPGTEALEVGGDWYDVFRLPGSCVALVIGDVVGHGLEAAVAMGQLRGAVRALAPGTGPAELLERLDVFVQGLPSASMATLTYAELDLSTGALRYASAGHPPPLVTSPEGGTHFLWGGRSTPLGCTFGDRRVEEVTALAAGDCLVLYTDGLIERRAESIDASFARLAEAAGTLRFFDGAFADRLSDQLLESAQHDDDACVLAVNVAPAALQFSRSVVAAPPEIGALRRQLGAWLAELGVHAETVQSVQLAVSEAVTNALEHGYGFDGRGVTSVDAQLHPDGELRITVRDEGQWQEPRPNSERGRGTSIMHSLMDHVSVEPGLAGTTVTMRLATRAKMAT